MNTTKTTESVLNELHDSIEHFNPKEWCDGVTLKSLRQDYEAYKCVANTMSLRELRLIALLRGCRVGDRQHFLTAAEQLFSALRYCDNLGSCTPPTD